VAQKRPKKDLELELDRSNLCFVRVAYWDRGSRAYVDEAFWRDVVVAPVGHTGEMRGVGFGILRTSARMLGSMLPDTSQAVFLLSVPGRYRFRLPASLLDEGVIREFELEVPSGISDLDFLSSN